MGEFRARAHSSRQARPALEELHVPGIRRDGAVGSPTATSFPRAHVAMHPRGPNRLLFPCE
jgi:hypothetical protein